MQKASVTSGIGLGMSRTSSVVDSGGVALIRPCLWTAKKAHQMIKTLRKMSNWCVRLGPWLKMTLNRIEHILFKSHSNWSVAFKRSVAYGTSVISWGTRFWCEKRRIRTCGIVVALLHPCRHRSSNQREVWRVDSQLCKRSPWLQLGPVKVWAARCFCTESLSKLALLHDSAPWRMAIDCYCLSLSLHSSTAFCIHEPWAKDSNSNWLKHHFVIFCPGFAWISCLPFANCMILHTLNIQEGNQRIQPVCIPRLGFELLLLLGIWNGWLHPQKSWRSHLFVALHGLSDDCFRQSLYVNSEMAWPSFLPAL